MNSFKSAGTLQYRGILYRLFWDPSNGEIWYSEGNSKAKFQIANISATTKKDVPKVFLKYLKSQDLE